MDIWDDLAQRNSAHLRERFLTGDLVAEGPQNAILGSWWRSQVLNVSPDRCSPVYDPDLDLDTRLVRAADPVLDRLASMIAGTWVCVCLTDDQARILAHRVGEASFGLHPGFCVAEHLVGTSAVALALVERRPARVSGAEHFADLYQPDACISAPVRDPLSGRIEGVFSLICRLAEANPSAEAMVGEAGRAIEHRLLEQASERERALLLAYRQAKHRMRIPAGGAQFPLDLDAGSGIEIKHDTRLVLQEKAAELIAAGRPTAIEVSLPHGQTATLVCREVRTHSAVAGLAVEVVLPFGPPRRLMTSAAAVAGHLNSQPRGADAGAPSAPGLFLPYAALSAPRPTPRLPAGAPDATRPASTPVASAYPASRQPAIGASLLAIGEQGIGRLAVAARRRLTLLYEASMHIGTTLDVTRTAEELAQAAVPELADVVTVDLSESVLRGEDSLRPTALLRRAALHGIQEGLALYPAGHQISFLPSTPQARCLASGRAVLEADLHAAPGWQAQDPERVEQLLAQGIHSLITVPLCARDVMFGVASFCRSRQPEPYEDDDLALAEELAARAALCLDNAHRYTRERQLHHQALHDPLTDLANRTLLTARLQRGLARRLHDNTQDDTQLALLFCDLDDFKSVNDRFGHAAGDDLLRVTAGRLTSCARSTDTVARISGDEFAVLLEGGCVDPESIGRRILETLRVPLVLAGTVHTTQASIGLVVVDPGTQATAESVLKQADSAMYAAKRRGKGTLVVYRPELCPASAEDALRTSLTHAVRGEDGGGTLNVSYQPIIELHTGRTVGVEAALRWDDPSSRSVPHHRLTLTAQQTGLAPALEHILLDRACRDLGRYRSTGHPEVALHIPVSILDAADARFTTEVVNALTVHHLPPDALVLRVAGATHHTDQAALRALRGLAARGIRLAITYPDAEDLSFDPLLPLPVQIIVLDAAATRHLTESLTDGRTPGEEENDGTLRTAFLATIRGLGISLLGTGIADAKQAATLAHSGCGLGQGSLFGGPAPLADIPGRYPT
ncbi:hypothetical protein ThrDRAFT_01389 [Frankia casuarinae]|uniref:Diguanylate cyclase/phosphodiesterase n=2 Tax=Frankia casuarinae (strain DSM 45818 / CECT 9043 / HFP020203 / CcI3) TaxID=106370 RepID=Q2JG28_FRACC|nr:MULTISPECIES: diguanylate cyclase [Frankia]ABD09764.1 diguanylate cyclase/phosphodiesterase [Frankia casuarinae]ETA02255.1 hypothetical protein CcI6DRAFT_02244 [Frankia sp. CcI6]EYT93006.1 hypothetical protein ThrDRAFT_01389 [Frankia casuarinae]KDA43289.1 hypothetical protein BMG523Draft_01790 [Frankia sp. BMG5.23]KEZ36747.1 diguanylate cyclase (GGDEF) domain-containing protein [Frankia sp. CeD]